MEVGLYCHDKIYIYKMESIRKLSNFNFQWAKTLYQNNLNNIALKGYRCKILVICNNNVTPLLCQLNWLSVKQQLYLRDAVMTYKCVNNLTPMYLSSNVNQRTTIHSRYTCYRNDLAIPLFRTVSGQRSFAYRSVKIWNDLKSPLKSSTSVATFKNFKKLRDSIQSADIVI